MSEELKAAQARIAELEGALSWHEEQRNDMAEIRAELAAIKAQEPVARLPACPSRAFAVANLRDLAQSVLQHDPDVGMFRDEDQAFLINELADLAESFNGDVKLYAAPVSEAKAQGVALDGSQLAGLLEQVRLDDDEAKPHGSGAAYWNNAVIACQVAIRDALAAPVQQVSVPAWLAIQVCKLGRYGAAFDPASTHYAYTYTDQPDNVGAMKLGRASAINATRTHGDEIDRGLHLLLQLQAEGFGVFQVAAAPAAPAADALYEAVTPNVVEWLRCGLAANNRLVDGTHPALELVRAALAARRSTGVV